MIKVASRTDKTAQRLVMGSHPRRIERRSGVPSQIFLLSYVSKDTKN